MEAFIKLITPAMFTATVGLFAWIIRKIYKIEGKVETHDKEVTELKINQKEEIKELKVKIDTMNDRISEKLTELCVSIAGIAGILKGKEYKD